MKEKPGATLTAREDRALWRLSVPIMISFTTRFLFGLVDLGYAAVLADQDAVAAIGFYIPFQAFYIAIWVGLSAGFTANLSQAFGFQDRERVLALKRSMLRLLAFLIPILVLLGIGFLQFLPALGLEEGLAAAFALYAGTLMIGSPLTGFWSIYPDSIVKAHHDTRSTMIAGLISTVSNVLMNTIFVFGFGMGIFGIALGTVASRFASLIYAALRARRLEQERMEREDEDWSEERLPERLEGAPANYLRTPGLAILLLSLPSAIGYLLQALEGAIVNKVLTGMENQAAAIASYGAYARLLGLALMPTMGASVAVLPYVARLASQRRLSRLRKELFQTLLFCGVCAAVLTIPIAFVLPERISFWMLPESAAGQGASDPRLAVLVSALHLLPVAALGALPFLLLRPVFEAVGRPKGALLLSAARFTVLSLPCLLGGVWLAPSLGQPALLGAIAGLIVASALASLLTLVSVRRFL